MLVINSAIYRLALFGKQYGGRRQLLFPCSLFSWCSRSVHNSSPVSVQPQAGTLALGLSNLPFPS